MVLNKKYFEMFVAAKTKKEKWEKIKSFFDTIQFGDQLFYRFKVEPGKRGSLNNLTFYNENGTCIRFTNKYKAWVNGTPIDFDTAYEKFIKGSIGKQVFKVLLK